MAGTIAGSEPRIGKQLAAAPGAGYRDARVQGSRPAGNSSTRTSEVSAAGAVDEAPRVAAGG